MKANILNEYFSSVFTRENPSNVPDVHDRNYSASLEHIYIDQDIVKRYLLQLKPGKSMGVDNIHPAILKNLSEVFAKPLTEIFQTSIESGRLPYDWKDACVTPLFKKGSKTEPGNYRPVSLTSIVCKVMEKIIRKHIIDHLDYNSFISNYQYGFRSGRSCVLQLLDVLEDWSGYIDNGVPFDTVYLDFAKAFDTVPHKRLLDKISSYGIKGNIQLWIRDFLSGRRQRVSVEGCLSDWREVVSGVPQGSVLGPVLFVIFINDLPEAVHKIVKMFADDTKVYCPISDWSDKEELQEDLNSMCDWSDTWQLLFNVGKCKVIHYGKNNPEYTYYMKSNELSAAHEEKDLGVVFQRDLKFGSHISQKVNKANSMLGIIRKTFDFLDQEIFLKLYKSLVRPHVEYANVVWYPNYKKDIESIERVQRRATKLLPELRHLPYHERLKKLKLPTLSHRRKRGDLIQAFKIRRSLLTAGCHQRKFAGDSRLSPANFRW